MPWACLLSGLACDPPNRGWGHVWLEAVHDWLNLLPVAERAKVDFLLPRKACSQGVVAKMSSDSAALRLRNVLIKCGVPADRAKEYSTHSCKDTLLAGGKQALLPKEQLAQHGKHRESVGRALGSSLLS